MSQDRHLTAIGLAHALLAGGMRRDELLARAQAALGSQPAWLPITLEDIVPATRSTWDRMTVQSLAARLEASTAFVDSFHTAQPPAIRRWILRESHMLPRPLGLDHLTLPQLDHSDALARWLGIPVDDLLWLSDCPPRRRHQPLHRQHYSFGIMAKRAGGARLIEAPRQRLKAVQTRILRDLLDRVPVHEACQGFVRERSVMTHAQAHLGRPVVLRYDLQDFFATVSAAQVRALFRTLGFPPGVSEQLTALCTVQTPDAVLARLREDGSLNWLQAKLLRSAHLPQGAPTSPMLANLCAFRLDLRLEGLSHALGASYSRYADDLVFSGPASMRTTAARLSSWVGKIAIEEGYRINHRKTRLMTRASAQTVCGIVVNDHPNLRRTDFDRLRATLHRCVVRGPAAEHGGDVHEWRDRLHGRLMWAEQVNPGKARRLRAIWGRIQWPSAGPQ